MTTIQEAKDLNVLPLEVLLGSLITHELTMKQRNNEKVKKKRTIGLKSSIEEEKDEASLEEDDSDEDMALIIKKFKKSFKIKRQGFKKRSMAKRESSKDKDKKRESSSLFA